MELKKYRKRAGLTQAQIAELLGIPTRTYQNYEREKRDADSEILCKLADVYNVSLDDLMGRKFEYAVIDTESGEYIPLSESEYLLSIYSKLDRDGKTALIDQAEYQLAKAMRNKERNQHAMP